ncbi:MAG: hypothetical protein P4M14_05585 [Gammaproteobacteria bacterium]|nr:hypothetical protein [Gammaproteobacteria bacterium]
MNEYKLKKYIDKLKNTDIHSVKFGIYLQKINFYGGAGTNITKARDDWTGQAWKRVEQLEQQCKKPLYDCGKVPLADKIKCDKQNEIYKTNCENELKDAHDYYNEISRDSK